MQNATTNQKRTRLTRTQRARELRRVRRLARENPSLVISRNREQIIVAVHKEIFDGWKKYGRSSYPRSHVACFVARAGVSGKNWTQDYPSIRSLRAAYPTIDNRLRAREASALRLKNIINGSEEMIVYKTLHVAEDGRLLSPYDGSPWEIGVPRETEMLPIGNLDHECKRGGFFCTRTPCEWSKYPAAATGRTDRLIVVQCIARDIEALAGKLRARILCPVGVVLGYEGDCGFYFCDSNARVFVA